MKNRNIHFLLAVITAAALLQSCTKEINPGQGEYGPGIFVVNEGSFGSNNASVSFIDRADGDSYNDIYALANNSLLLGDVAQSLTIADGKAYIVVNNSAKIEVVNVADFHNTATISGLTLPRFMVVNGNKAYLTQWVSLAGTGVVSVIDLSTNTIGANIPVGKLPEHMVMANGKLFVTNSNDTLVHIINPSADAVEGTVTVGDWPKQIVKDASGRVWVLCTGVPSWAGTPTAGRLMAIETSGYTVVKDFTFPGTSANPDFLCISPDGNTLYYSYNGGIYAMHTTDASLPTTPLIAAPASIYGMDVDPATGMLYVADAGGFTSGGWVKWYNTSGAIQDSAQVGIAPNGFTFLE